MIDEQALKERLQTIAASDYQAPSRPELTSLVAAMGSCSGAVDPELRDDLIYMTLATWIERDLFEAKELNEILMGSLDDQHLFYGLGDEENDTVFTRTFSMLIVAAVLNAHRRHTFLPENELRVTKLKILRNLAGERDLRGYVPVKGWAHAIAHAADALEELVQCQAMDGDDLRELLTAMRSVISRRETVYVHEEDERLVTAVLAAWRRREVTDDMIFEWLEGLAPSGSKPMSMPDGYRSFINRKNFLRSLTFRSHHLKLSEAVHLAIRQILAQFSLFEN